MKAAFKLHGEVAAIHGNSRRSSPRRLAEETRRRIVEIRGLEEHEGCDTALSAEILREDHGIAHTAEVMPRLLRACMPKARETDRSMARGRKFSCFKKGVGSGNFD